jgi:hypothetical protein
MRLVVTLLLAVLPCAALADEPWWTAPKHTGPAPKPWEPGKVPPRHDGEQAPRPAVRFELHPTAGYQVAATSYAFSFPASTTSSVRGSSQLDWPLNMFVAGVQARVSNEADRWSASGSFSGSLNNPVGTMLDRDWIDTTEFSHTDSATTASLWIADVTARYRFLAANFDDAEINVDALAGYRHEGLSTDAFGVTGWQLNQRGQQQPVSLGADKKVIHYESQRAMPHLGVGVRSRLYERLLMDFDAQLLIPISFDEDDHVLRHKLANATSAGVGLLVDCTPRWVVWGDPNRGLAVAVGADLQLRLLQTWGKLNQHYYDTDPYLAGVGPTTQIPSADESYTSALGSFRATVDLLF